VWSYIIIFWLPKRWAVEKLDCYCHYHIFLHGCSADETPTIVSFLNREPFSLATYTEEHSTWKYTFVEHKNFIKLKNDREHPGSWAKAVVVTGRSGTGTSAVVRSLNLVLLLLSSAIIANLLIKTNFVPRNIQHHGKLHKPSKTRKLCFALPQKYHCVNCPAHRIGNESHIFSLRRLDALVSTFDWQWSLLTLSPSLQALSGLRARGTIRLVHRFAL